MGEKEAKAKAKEDDKEKKDGKPKKEDADGPITAVLKIDLHCEGCAKRVRRCAGTFEGVEKVTVDTENSKITVVGKMDPWKLCQKLELKTHKKVTVLSPAKKKEEPKKEEANKKDEKKADKPKEVTVALKILLHCDGCVQKIRRTVLRFKGVEGVTVEANKDVVNVRGIMDVKALVPHLREKLRRDVQVVAPKDEKKGGGGEKKEKGGEGEKKKEEGGGGGEKKEGAGEGGGGGEKKKKEGGGGEGKVEVSKMEHLYYGGVGGGYYLQMVHAPQMFSDENPNACIVM